MHAGIPPQGTPLGAGTLPGSRHPPVQCMLGDSVNKRAVRILLESNLVWQDFCQKRHENERNWTKYPLNAQANNRVCFVSFLFQEMSK